MCCDGVLNFKAQLEQDLQDTFHNTSEFAELTDFYYNGYFYRLAVVVDATAGSERSTPYTDHAEGLHIDYRVIYFTLADLGFTPAMGAVVGLGSEVNRYTITAVDVDMGEIRLELKRVI